MSGVLHGLLAALKSAAAAIGWDLSTATFTPQWGALNVEPQDTVPQGIWMKDDGTKLYIVGSATDSIHEYNLSTAWVLSTATYLQSFSVASQDSTPAGLFFDPNGTRMYVVGVTSDSVYQYSLSSAWNISTASYTSNSFSVASQESGPNGVFLKPDGTKMYVIGSVSDSVHEYDLSTAWDVTTASFLQSFSVSAQDTIPQDIFFKDDGTVMYVVGDSGNDINQYALSTPWDISTATYSMNFLVSGQSSEPVGTFFKPDGSQFFIVSRSPSRACYSYTMGTAWTVNTASFDAPATDYFYVGGQEGTPTGLAFKPDGTKMYVIGSSADRIQEYALGTPWAVETATFTANVQVSAQDSSPQDLFFKPDGTKVYVIGQANDAVFEYDLTSAWDITSLSYTGNSFVVTSQEATPTGLFFKTDGTKMYVIGIGSDSVHEYDLSSAWDVTTASFLQSFSVATQDANPVSLYFKPDGLRMYVVGASGDSVYQYDLSSAWNVSTASFVVSFPFSFYEIAPTGVSFETNGTKMYMLGSGNDVVWAFSL